jgi:carbon-monoxide dehydrogenase large subunit
VLAEYDQATGRWTLRVGCQGVFGLRNGLANVLGVERDKVRVLTGNVGGSFGMKSAVYPEYLALFHAARALGRPVKWTDERSESFVSDNHGRDHEMTAELALDAEGNFLAVRVTGYGNLGAYVGRGAGGPPTANAVKNTIGVYKTPLIEVSTRIVVTNTVNDFGVIVNPLLVAGQAHGGVVHGIGQALMERTVFENIVERGV